MLGAARVQVVGGLLPRSPGFPRFRATLGAGTTLSTVRTVGMVSGQRRIRLTQQ